MRLKVFPVTSIGLPNLKFKLRPPEPPYVCIEVVEFFPLAISPEKSSYISMKPTFRRKGFSDMHAVNEESASTIVLAASTMPAFFLGGRHNVKAICLSLHVRQNNESVCVWKVIWRWAVALLSERTCHHHGQYVVSQKRGLTEFCGKIFSDLDFSFAVFAGIQSHWIHVEYFEEQCCWLCP